MKTHKGISWPKRAFLCLSGKVRPLLAFFGPQGLVGPKKAPGRAVRSFKAQIRPFKAFLGILRPTKAKTRPSKAHKGLFGPKRPKKAQEGLYGKVGPLLAFLGPNRAF